MGLSSSPTSPPVVVRQALAQEAGGQGGAGVWYHQALSKGNGLLQQCPERKAGGEDMGWDMKTSDTLYLLSPLCSPPLLTPPLHSPPRYCNHQETGTPVSRNYSLLYAQIL